MPRDRTELGAFLRSRRDRLITGGRPVSRPRVLDALARALRIDPTEHAHLIDLAAPATRTRSASLFPRSDPIPVCSV